MVGSSSKVPARRSDARPTEARGWVPTHLRSQKNVRKIVQERIGRNAKPLVTEVHVIRLEESVKGAPAIQRFGANGAFDQLRACFYGRPYRMIFRRTVGCINLASRCSERRSVAFVTKHQVTGAVRIWVLMRVPT